MMNYVHVWHLAQFFLEWQMLETNILKKINTHIVS